MTRAWLGWALTRIGYVIRPYDMLADRRRWWWQPRTLCSFLHPHRLGHCSRQQVWWFPPDCRAPVNITGRVAARHVPGCDRICLDTPAGPCADECAMQWAARVPKDGAP
jgi:hypothetical protein